MPSGHILMVGWFILRITSFSTTRIPFGTCHFLTTESVLQGCFAFEEDEIKLLMAISIEHASATLITATGHALRENLMRIANEVGRRPN
ncbi:hypothetical protein BGZ80_003254, partial [Entomortierella chlamydospora]